MKRISWRAWWKQHVPQRASKRSRTQQFVPVELASQTLESRLVLAAPTLAAISNVTLRSGSPLIIPLNGADADNQALTFTASSTNSAVTTQIPTGNRSLKMDVANFGTMTFQLFEDRVPRVTSHIIELANSDFYNGSKFHRVINNFVIQGGDPFGNPTGTGGSSLGDFDDQFDVDLQHNRAGLLSMAKGQDDTNDSQFFVTEVSPTKGPPRYLDFNHSIFGMLTTGESVREAISNVPVIDEVPITNVVVSNVEVFTDTQNGVLFLKAPEGTTGTSTITVTVTDPNGNTAQRQFTVTVVADPAPVLNPTTGQIEDLNNGAPFLADVPKLRTLVNSPFTFQLKSIDAENDSAFFLSPEVLAYYRLSIPVVANTNLGYTVDFNTGIVNLTPSNGLTGDQRFTVATAVSTQAVDYQVPTLSIVQAASPLTVSGADHPSVSQANDGKADTFLIARNGANVEVRINGQISQIALLASVTTLNLNGSNDADKFVIDYSGGNPLPSGGMVVSGGTGSDALQIGGNTAAITNVTHNPTDAASGNLVIDGGTVSYSTLEGLLDALAATNRTFQFGSAANTITIGDDGTAANSLSLVSSPASVPTQFTAPSAALVINGGAGNDSLTTNPLDSKFAIRAKLQGGDGNDVLFGAASADTLEGQLGDDTLFGGGGNDSLDGGADNDNINGQNGDDSIQGNDGNDILAGGAGRDTIAGGLGNDFISGQTEAGLLSGGSGNDTIQGNTADDTLNGDDGDDKLWGLTGNDLINGGNGADIVSGDAGNDTLNGDAGADILTGSIGNDSFNGGADTDRINEVIDGSVTVLAASSSSVSLGADTFVNIERLNLVGGAGANLFDARQTSLALLLSGEGGDDTLLGGTKGDVINGGDGNDVLSGGGGNDAIDGGLGTDYFYEKANTDFAINGLQVSSAITGTETVAAIERIAIIGGVGNNTLNAQMSSVPVVLLGGLGNDTLFGGSLADTLSGGSRGDSTVAGSDGVDSLNGGAAADTYEADSSDTLVVVANVDVTTANVFATLPSWIDQL